MPAEATPFSLFPLSEDTTSYRKLSAPWRLSIEVTLKTYPAVTTIGASAPGGVPSRHKDHALLAGGG